MRRPSDRFRSFLVSLLYFLALGPGTLGLMWGLAFLFLPRLEALEAPLRGALTWGDLTFLALGALGFVYLLRHRRGRLVEIYDQEVRALYALNLRRNLRFLGKLLASYLFLYLVVRLVDAVLEIKFGGSPLIPENWALPFPCVSEGRFSSWEGFLVVLTWFPGAFSEEFFFRFLPYRLGGVPGLVGAAAAFALIHLPGQEDLLRLSLAYAFISVALSFIYWWTRSLLAVSLLHAAVNADVFWWRVCLQPLWSKWTWCF